MRALRSIFSSFLAASLLLAGCSIGPHVLPPSAQKTVDRRITEYPSGFVLQPYVVNLDAPSAVCWDDGHDLIIAESGAEGADPHIFGIRPDGTKFNIYPSHSRVPIISPGFHLYGPIGGMLFYHGRVYVSHRDDHGLGCITAFGMDGSHQSIVGGLPARGDYSVTDLAISRDDGQLYFGVGAATNSGVVGLDNWDEGWVSQYPQTCDLPLKEMRLRGYRIQTKNPQATVFSSDIVDTVPFEPFGVSDKTRVAKAPMGKPTGAIYAVSPDGGDCHVVASGVRNPAGLFADEFGRIYFTDQGMEMRGSRPVANDPDVLFHLVSGEWYGFPDYSRSLEPINEQQFQPPSWLVLPTKYPDIGLVIDQKLSNLDDPDQKWVQAKFKALAGASKMDIVPASGPFSSYVGKLVVAMWGTREPFATSGQPLVQPPPGYKIVLVDKELGQVKDFVFNTEGGPASALSDGGLQALERPIDVKFGPDGYLYIVDFGQIRMNGGREKVNDGTGKIFRLIPASAATQSSSRATTTNP